MTGPVPLSDGIEAFLARFGLPSPEVSQSIFDRWHDVGPPWSEHARPVVLRGGELVVEALAPSMVSVLRYAVGNLHKALDELLGPGVVTSVTVRPPGRRDGIRSAP